MLKQKLSKQALEEMIEKCRVTTTDAVPVEFIERDDNDPNLVKNTVLDLKKIREPDFIAEMEYLLGQIGVYHTSNKIMIYEQLAFLQNGENWTGNDRILLNQLVRLGMMSGTIRPFRKETVKGKEISISNLDRKQGRIKPVTHVEKTPEEK